MGKFMNEVRSKYRDAYWSNSNVYQSFFYELLERAKKDFPTTNEIQMAIAQLLNFMPEGKVRTHIQNLLTEQYSATWKWFGEGD